MNENTTNLPPSYDPMKRMRFALFRTIAALLITVVLFAAFYSPIMTLARRPADMGSIETEEQGAFVQTDISFIMGVYSEEGGVRYALVPMGSKFVTVRLTGRYAKSADKLLANTYDYINGEINFPDEYISVQGVVGMLTEDKAALMYDWFGANKGQLVEMSMIADTDDYAEYLSDYILTVDYVSGVHQNLLFALIGLLVVLAFYVLIELFLMACGFYLLVPDEGEDDALLESDEDSEGEDDDSASDDAEADDDSGSDADEADGEAVSDDEAGDDTDDEAISDNADDEATPDTAAEESAETPGDAVESAPESQGGAETEIPPAEADGEDSGEGEGDA